MTGGGELAQDLQLVGRDPQKLPGLSWLLCGWDWAPQWPLPALARLAVALFPDFPASLSGSLS